MERTVQASYDPANASFSYALNDRTNLWGPFCVGCLNDWYVSNYFHMEMDTHFYLHLKKCGRHYYLSELISDNGSLRPFSMRQIPEELKLLDCERPNCRHQKHIPSVETTSVGVQTLRDVVVQPSASVPSLLPPPLSLVQPKPSPAPLPPPLIAPISVAPPQPPKPSSKIPPSNGYNVKMVSNGTSTSNGFVANRSLTQENPVYVTERRPVEFPLLFGTSYRLSSKVTEQIWIARSSMTMQIYEGMKEEFSKGLEEAFAQIGWKTTDCDVCPLIRAKEPYVEHVLSDYHRKNLYARGRWVTNGHFDMLDGFLRKQERQLKNQQKQGTKSASPPLPPPLPLPTRQPSRPSTPLVPESLLHFPLMPLWNTLYPEEAKMSWSELLAKAEDILALSRTTNMKKLNEKYGSNVDKSQNRCNWCNEDVKELSDVVGHVCSAKHLQTAFNRFHITIKDVNEYMNLLRGAQLTKLPEKTTSNSASPKPPSPEPTALSRVASTSSVASSRASSSITVDPNAIRLPFLEGSAKPGIIMSKDSVVGFGLKVLGILKNVPCFKSAVNSVLAKKGTCLLVCVACSKRMPGPVSVVEHVMSTAHIATIITPTRGFCKRADYAPLVSILLDAKGMTHPPITAANAEVYFDMLTYSVSSLVEKEKKEAPQNNAVGSFVPPSNINTVPFFEGRTNARSPLTVGFVLNKTSMLRKLVSNSPVLKKNLTQIMKGNGTAVAPCKLCSVKLSCLVSMLEHAFSTSHIEKVYHSGKSFCQIGDFLIAVQLIASAVGDKQVVMSEKAETKLDGYAKMTNIKPLSTPSAPTVYVSRTLTTASASASSTKRVVRIVSKSQQDEEDEGKEAVTVEVENDEEHEYNKEEMRVAAEEEERVKLEEAERHKEELKKTTVTFNAEKESNPDYSVNVGLINAVEVETNEEGTREDEEETEEEELKNTTVTLNVEKEANPECSANVGHINAVEVEVAEDEPRDEKETETASASDDLRESPEQQQPVVKDLPSSSRTVQCLVKPRTYKYKKPCELFNQDDYYDHVSTVRYLNKEWSDNVEGIGIPEEEVRQLAKRILETYGPLRSLNKNVRCDTGDCWFIRECCPPKCDLCRHESICICDYILHLFGNIHLKKILKDKRPVPIKHVVFWLKVLKELHPNITFKTRFDDRLDFYVPYLEPKKFDIVPICPIVNAAYFLIMNAASLDSTEKILTGQQLRLLSGKVIVSVGGTKCFHPTNSNMLSALPLFCSNVCIICRYKSKCVCDYIIHLFDATHVGTLIAYNIPISTGDVQFWVEQLQYTSYGDAEVCEALGMIWEQSGIKLTGYDQNMLEALTPRLGCEPVHNAAHYKSLYIRPLTGLPRELFNVTTSSHKSKDDDKCAIS